MFFIAFWGEKKTETRLGFAADFCPVCRKISTFEVNRVGVAAHVYFVAVNEGSFVSHNQRCNTCSTTLESTPARFFSLSDTATSSIEELVQATFPTIYEVFGERLALERQISADPHSFDPATRKKLLMEPFQFVSPYFENHRRETGLEILVTTLRPLDPSEDEVRECLNQFRRVRAKMGVMIRTATVMRSLTRTPSAHDYNY